MASTLLPLDSDNYQRGKSIDSSVAYGVGGGRIKDVVGPNQKKIVQCRGSVAPSMLVAEQFQFSLDGGFVQNSHGQSVVWKEMAVPIL